MSGFGSGGVRRVGITCGRHRSVRIQACSLFSGSDQCQQLPACEPQLIVCVAHSQRQLSAPPNAPFRASSALPEADRSWMQWTEAVNTATVLRIGVAGAIPGSLRSPWGSGFRMADFKARYGNERDAAGTAVTERRAAGQFATGWPDHRLLNEMERRAARHLRFAARSEAWQE